MKIMNILLLNAPWQTVTGYGVRSNSRWPHTRKDKVIPFPIYLAYTAAVLEENDFDVNVIDAVADDKNIADVIQDINLENYELVVIETSTPSIYYDLKMAQEIKNNINIKIALIGPHATVFDRDILADYSFIDYIARGEFEYIIRDLSKYLRGDYDSIMGVKGLSYRNEGKIIRNPDYPLIDNLDELPLPARHLFNMKKYDSHLYKSPSFLMITSRGCPMKCIYCLWPQTMYGHEFRARNAKKVVDEMEYLINEYNAREICFDDDTFTIGKKRLIGIMDEIQKRGLKVSWSCFGRVDIDKETLLHMREAGCELIRYGVESGSQEMLDICKKNITLEQVRNAFKWTDEVEIRSYGTFMFGLPGETWNTAKKTIEFAKELDPHAVQFSIVAPFPGTEYYDILKSKGLLKIDDWSFFDGGSRTVIETEELSKEDLEMVLALSWKEFYLRPEFILKSLRRNCNSIHDLKRLILGAKSFIIRWIYYRKKIN